jgi:hypothetical protein
MRTRYLLAASVLFLLPRFGQAQRRPDPLTPGEIEQLRDTALEPNDRIKLLVSFARDRLAAVEAVEKDPKVTNRGSTTHDKLQSFLDVYDELNDNIDMYDDRKDDMRKGLKAAIEADSEFAAKLRAMKDAAGVPKQQSDQYQFLLSDAIDAVDTATDDHRKTMESQEQLAKQRKKQSH